VLHKEIPFLRILIPLISGIIAGLYLALPLWPVIISLILIAALIMFRLVSHNSQTDYLSGLALTLSLAFCGYLLYSIEKQKINTFKLKQTDFLCTLSDYPEPRGNSYRVKARLDAVIEKSELKTVSGSMLLYIKNDTSIAAMLPGDILKFSCLPSEITNRGNPCEFDYKFYMENQGIRYLAFISKKDIKERYVPVRREIKHRALIIRESIIEMYRNRGITGRRLALVAAMTVGEKTMLEPEQKENFVKAGVMHIMAVSGLHAVVLSMFVFNMLFFLKRRFNILRIIIALLIIWAFAFVTGLTPSVMRATLMFSFIQAGSLLKRPASSMNSVLASAFVLILIRPSVIFDAGFLLSYSAVIFIIAFYKEIYLKLQIKNLLADKIWQSIVVTLVAQAGTLPLTIMLFNRFPAYFLLTNLIIVPLSSLIIVTGCLIPVLYPVVFLSRLLASALNLMTGFTEYLTEKAASLPGSTIEQIGMTVPECILLTIVISLLGAYIIKRDTQSITYLLVVILMISTVSTAKNISVRRSDELIIYNVPGKTAVGIRTGKDLILYSTEGTVTAEVTRHCSNLNLRIAGIHTIDKPVGILAGEKRILLAEMLTRKSLSEASPDILILTGTRPHIKECSGIDRYPENVIISSECSSGLRIPGDFKGLLKNPVWHVRKNGAFMMTLQE
jgi:competence protein ComEC